MQRGVALIFVGLVGLVFGAAACSHGSTPGHIKCTNKSFLDVGAACTISYSSCDDGKIYETTCANDICTCTVDGLDNGTKGLTDCGSDSGEMNFDCGFDITE